MAAANVVNTLVVPAQSKVAPYYDDFNEEKNFHRIMFRPGYAVQARELTQLQTILQNQIERFGRHIFVNGSSVIGGKIDVTDVVTLNVESRYINTDIDVNNFLNKTVYSGTGTDSVIARVIQVSPASNTAPAALHVKYQTGTEFGPGSTITTSSGDFSANLTAYANASSNGSIAFIYDSIYFINGYFVKVPSQAAVLDKHNVAPTGKIGLEVTDSIITEASDITLLDPALEASNYQAPGAGRYTVDLTLAKRSLDSVDDEKFITIATIENGNIKEQVKNPIYSEIEDVFARRTYDESGNYTVRPFDLAVIPSSLDSSNNFTLNITPGKAYLYGYETELQNGSYIEIPRARTTKSVSNYNLNMNYGNYVYVENVTGNFDIAGQGVVDLHCVTSDLIDRSSSTGYFSTKIGTARIKDLEFYSGDENVAARKFEFYFYDTIFGSIPGSPYTASTDQSQIYLGIDASNVDDAYTGAFIYIKSGKSESDLRVISAYDGAKRLATVSTPFTVIPDTTSSYELRFDITDVDSFATSSSYTESSIGNAGASIALISKDTRLLTGNTVISETTLTNSFFMYPKSYIAPGITNKTYSYRKAFTSKTFTNGVLNPPISAGTEHFLGDTVSSNVAFSAMDNFFVVVTDPLSSSRTLGEQIPVTVDIDTSGASELATLYTGNTSETFTATIYAKMEATGSDANQRTKSLILANTTTFSSASASNTFTNSTGSVTSVYLNAGQVVIYKPSATETESLFISDVLAVKKIYASDNAPTAGQSLTGLQDVTNRYVIERGQRPNYYDHATLKLKPGFASPKNYIIVCCRYYSSSSDVGYFSVDSYPNLNTTVTEEGVDLGTGYSLIPTVNGVRLADMIDFRPVRRNADNTKNFNFASARSPIVLSDFLSSYSYYLPRYDIVTLSLDKKINLIQGTSSEFPTFPTTPYRHLVLHKLQLSPYTVNPSSIITTSMDYKRYTMQDISHIDRRLKNVEYYVQLNTLQKSAEQMSIKDVDGLERTKYGILAEDFSSHIFGDITSPDYFCQVDYQGKISPTGSALMPAWSEEHITLECNTGVSTVSIHDRKATLPYSTQVAITQGTATKSVPINEYLFAKFRGQIITIPEADIWRDTTTLNPIAQIIPVGTNYDITNNYYITNEYNTFNYSNVVNTTVINVTPTAPTFTLFGTPASANEGEVITFTLVTTGVPALSRVPFTLSGTGIEAGDFSSMRVNGNTVTSSLTGEFVIIPNGSAGYSTLTLLTAEDCLLEGDETLTITANVASNSVTIIDTSNTVAVPVSYNLEVSANSVNEGETVVFTLTTTSVQSGTGIPFVINGDNITLQDIDNMSVNDIAIPKSLTGNQFVVQRSGGVTANVGASTLAIKFANDLTTEGTERLFVIATGEYSVSNSVNILDTNTAPSLSYTVLSSANAVNEGEAAIFTVKTTGLPDGSNVPFTLSGTGITTADISLMKINGQTVIPTLSENVKVSGSVTGATGDVTLHFANDLTTEGTERLFFSVPTTSNSVNILDTNTAPPAISYTVLSSANAVNEGEIAIFTVKTTGIANNTNVPFTISGANVTAKDIDYMFINDANSFPTLSGNVRVFGNTTYAYGDVRLHFAEDLTTENTERLFFSVPTTSNSVNILDTSKKIYDVTYTVLSSANSVNEGESAIFTVKTTGLPDGSNVAFTLSGTGVTTSDIDYMFINGSNTNPTLSSNVKVFGDESAAYGQVSLHFARDAATEGTERLFFSVPTTSNSVNILDSSPNTVVSYVIYRSAEPINEGQYVTFTFQTTNVPGGTLFGWNLTGTGITTADISYMDISGSSITPVLSGTFVTIGTTSNTTAQATITIRAATDQKTEGTERMNLTVANSSTLVTVANSYVNILDTSVDPVNPAYSLTASSSSINEGDYVTYTFTTYNINPAAYTWSLAGTGITVDDITNMSVNGVSISPTLSGSFTTTGTSTSSAATIRLQAKLDTAIESPETLTCTVKDSTLTTRGTASVIINDTTPQPAYSLTATPATISEGGDYATFNFVTTNISPGTYSWNLSGAGITLSDISNMEIAGVAITPALSGSFTTTGSYSSASTSLRVKAIIDTITETSETLTLTVKDSGLTTRGTASVTIVDTIPPATYTIQRITFNGETDSVYEGDVVQFKLITTNIPVGTSIPYLFSGTNITASDIQYVVVNNNKIYYDRRPTYTSAFVSQVNNILTTSNYNPITQVDNILSTASGPSFIILPDGTSTLTVRFSNDALSEGTERMNVYAFSAGTTSYTPGGSVASNYVNILDVYPQAGTIRLDASLPYIIEGDSDEFILRTDKIDAGTLIPYTIAGRNLATSEITSMFYRNGIDGNYASQSVSLTGNFTVFPLLDPNWQGLNFRSLGAGAFKLTTYKSDCVAGVETLNVSATYNSTKAWANVGVAQQCSIPPTVYYDYLFGAYTDITINKGLGKLTFTAPWSWNSVGGAVTTWLESYYTTYTMINITYKVIPTIGAQKLWILDLVRKEAQGLGFNPNNISTLWWNNISTQMLDVIYNAYLTTLNRPPDFPGFCYWAVMASYYNWPLNEIGDAIFGTAVGDWPPGSALGGAELTNELIQPNYIGYSLYPNTVITTAGSVITDTNRIGTFVSTQTTVYDTAGSGLYRFTKDPGNADNDYGDPYTYVAMLFQTVLGRTGTQQEYQTYVNRYYIDLNKGWTKQTAYKDLYQMIVASAENQNAGFINTWSI